MTAEKKIDAHTAELGERTARVETKIDTLTDIAQRLEDKLDTNQKALGNIAKWREGVDTERKFVRVAVPIMASAIIAFASNSCSLHPNVSPLVTSTPIAIYTLAPTDTPTPTAEPTPAPIPPATDTPTPDPTRAPTVDWSATPTRQTNTPSIIEVTPLGDGYHWTTAIPKIQALDAWYVPSARQNVRLGPGIEYPVKYRISAGQKVQVYAEVLEMPTAAWLCLDVGRLCDEAVALVWEKAFMGELIYAE